MAKKYIDLTGQKFHNLTVLSRAQKPVGVKARSAYWLCQCKCGNQMVTQGRSLRSGLTKSCGCIAGQHTITHGMTKSPEFSTWSAMIERCRNPNHKAFKNYGGRGISVCERWKQFENFLADMGLKPTPKHQIDRTDNNGDYEPNNCRWVTPQENLNNRRSNHVVKYDGETMTLSQAANESGLHPATLAYRAKAGIPLESKIRETKKYNIFGEMMTLTEASQRLGIKRGTLQSRIQRGIPLTSPIKEPRLVDVEGEKLTITEAASKLGLAENTIKNRIAKGYPLTSSRLRGR